MKYEEATKYLYEAIVNYDNKSKKAYLLLLQILCDINEYNRAKLLIAKIYKMFDNENDLNEFKEIDKEVDSCINISHHRIFLHIHRCKTLVKMQYRSLSRFGICNCIFHILVPQL